MEEQRSDKRVGIAPLAPIGDSLLRHAIARDTDRSSGSDTHANSTITSELREAARQRDHNVETWSKVCDNEHADVRDEALRFERQLQNALRSTEHLGVPNAFRTAICLEVLAKMSVKFDRFRQIMDTVRREAECAIYLAPSSTNSESGIDRSNRSSSPAIPTLDVAFSRTPYFAELKRVTADREALESDLARLDDMHAFMTAQLRNNEQMVDRLAQRWARVVMKQTLVDWKKIIIRKKYTRVLLEKTSGRWSKQRLLRLFRRWAAFAGAEKLRKTKLQLAHYDENRLDFQDLLAKLEQSIESTKLETRANREHVDFAKRQLLGLDDLLHQLDVRVRQSNERRLQHIVNAWGRLCFALVDCEVLHLQNMLDAVALPQFVDVALLAAKGEELTELLNLPSDVLVLRWINFQLAQSRTFQYSSASAVATAGSSIVQNFTTDMRSHFVLRHILYRVLTLRANSDAVSSSLQRMATFVAPRDGSTIEPTPAPFAQRDELRAALVERLNPSCPAFLSDQVLECGTANGDRMFCLFAFLACEHPSLRLANVAATAPVPVGALPRQATATNVRLAPACPWQEAQTALDDARAIWESIRVQWTELQTPFEIQEDTKTTPDVTVPPQLLVKANSALQNAVHMVQYACSKRSVVMKTWSCVQRKVQQDALRLLMRRGRNDAPLVLLDRRAWREKYLLTTVHVARLVAQFVAPHDNQTNSNNSNSSKRERERNYYEHKLPPTRERLEVELLGVEAVLEEHYKALRRVYRRCAGVENTLEEPVNQHLQRVDDDDEEEARFFHKIAMPMSLLEFHTLLKDSRVFGTTRPFPYTFIRHVFEQVSPSVARTTDATVLAAPGQRVVVLAADSSSNSNNNNSDAGSKHNRASEMTPAEFVEALVHIARSKYVCFKRAGAHATTLSLAQRVHKCIETIVLPRATLETKENVFRPQLLTPECRNIVAKHHKKLVALYTRFASASSSSSSSSSSSNSDRVQTSKHESLLPSHVAKATTTYMLSVTGFVVLCRHFELLREHFLNLDDVQHVLAEVLQLERESVVVHSSGESTTSASHAIRSSSSSNDTVERGGESREPVAHDARAAASAATVAERSLAGTADETFLTYAEFVEVLAALACYLQPGAFVPLATKIDAFCLQELHFGFAT